MISARTLAATLALLAALPNPSHAQGDEWELQKLTTEDSAPIGYMMYGYSLGMSGGRAVVGAVYMNMIGDVSSGFAYVYRRDGIRWIQEGRLSSSDPPLIDHFGHSVAISGDYIVVGDWPRSAYVFHRKKSGWAQQAKLAPADNPDWNSFGRPVAISGDVVVIGAAEDDDGGTFAGAAYVYRRSGTDWIQEAKLIASDPAAYDGCGYSLDIDGDYVLLGCGGDDDAGSCSGSVRVFRFNGTGWVEDGKSIGADTAAGDYFGYPVDLDRRYALIEARFHEEPPAMFYTFRREGIGWIEEPKLVPHDAQNECCLTIALSGDYALLGNFGDDHAGTDSGSAYLFKRSGGTWTQTAKLVASDAASYDGLGDRVAIDDGYALVVSLGDDHRYDLRGSVYVYVYPGASLYMSDYARLQRCFAGEGGGVPLDCNGFDVEPDGDVDLNDYRWLARTFPGP